MKESNFIKKNKDKWRVAEQTNVSQAKDFYDMYNDISNDSAYAQTKYKNRSVRVYLNHLLVKLQGGIINKRRNGKDSLLYFWTYHVPKALYESRFKLLLSFLVFTFCVLIGYYSSAMDAQFFEEFFGSGYTTTTLQNIEKGDPLAIYKDQNQMSMFLQIGFNNVKVGLFAFALGCLFGVGSLFMMLINGIMLGSFMEFFFKRGLWQDFTYTVWMHGTFEIAMLIIVASAGFTMGYGLVAKGHQSTIQSFYKSSRRGVVILIATIPFTILAAIIESFITRYTELPNGFRGAFITVCFLITLYYFVIYPLILAKKGKFLNDEELVLAEVKQNTKEGYRKHQFSMRESILFIQQNAAKILLWLGSITTFMLIYNSLVPTYLIEQTKHITAFNFGQASSVLNLFTGLILLPGNMQNTLTNMHWLYQSLTISFLLIYISHKWLKSQKFNWKKALITILAMSIFWYLVKAGNTFTTILLVPLFFSFLAALTIDTKHVLLNTFRYGFLNGQTWFSYFTAVLVTYLIAYLLHSPLFWTLLEVIQLFVAKEDIAYEVLSRYVLFSLSLLTLLVFCVIYFLNVLSNYYYKKERTELNELENAIKDLKPSRRILGYEVES
jgi:uncharacterized membrane protein SpoIIM required for sporulation